ncbi:L-arabinokinase-like isoform X2 [Typha latifolia]|uniref:L-arabinokinase-like isoform X2 n=1 Tax=Typha latifolia TaxID=4733 RepID=UPI003C2C5B88
MSCSLTFAYYVTGHGFGHATRVAEVVHHLIAAGHRVHIVTGAPDYVYTSEINSHNLHLRKVLLDCGAVQADALTVDRLASLEKYAQTAVVPRASILETEVEWLKSIKADLVVSDVVPIACRAAADAGIRSVCVTNFSWDFIYAEYVIEAGYHHRSTVWQIAEDYSHCELVLRLPGYCPMPAFQDVVDVPLVVRRLRRSRPEVRKELGIGDDVKLVIFNFGGQPASWKLKQEWLPAGWLCLVCGAPEDQELPPNFIRLAKDVYTPDLIAASDCMLGKIGYGTLSEALAFKLPFVFVRRDYFNEEPFLRHILEYYKGGIEMIRRDLLSGQWMPYLARALTLTPCYDGGINGGEVVSDILQDIANGKRHASAKSGVRRLRDAIVLGYQLQRAPGTKINIPEWYSLAENEACLHVASSNTEENGTWSSVESYTENFEILYGELQGLSDTVAFLNSLSSLVSEAEPGKNIEKHFLRDKVAAAAMFNWEEEFYVARAPGRLDVMGGIADYSGSLVLQMPIREACHVAVQRNHPSKQKLWKHALARQTAKGWGCLPVLQIVSLGSDLSNRAPTFDMDLLDLMDGDQPISYEKAYKHFAQDPSQKWAAYVAGAIIVLMSELGVRFTDSISILVSSAVPEGKGVSSSAAVEVATMFAIAAAHGLDIASRDIALLCQKVENYIVGAPCGVMDQMTSACGETNKLLAMVCQPAEIKELVTIPTHLRFWGFDSGIRHSVGGADYASVRVGTFMGRKMIKFAASALLSQSLDGVVNSDKCEEQSVGLLKSEASLDYLCNLSTYRYESVYAKKLPESILGKTFLEKYVDHDDTVTTINPQHIYGVRAPTRHPIYENFRVEAFKALLTAGSTDEQLRTLGELMYQCHSSYNECGLGSDGTDRLVELVQEVQHRRSSQQGKGTLSGAKITGGGSGGSVCVIGRNCVKSSEEILEIQERYKAATGYLPYVFEGSSPGAGNFGYLKLRLRSSPSMVS